MPRFQKIGLEKLGAEWHGWLRERYYAAFGVPAPTVEMDSRQWAASRPGLGQWIEVSPPRAEIISPRKIEGAVDELSPHLKSQSLDRRHRYLEEIHPVGEYHFDSEYVVSIERGRVVGRTVAVITPDNCNLTDVGKIQFKSQGPHGRWNYRGGLPQPMRFRGKLGVLSYSVCGMNFFHFLVECLPKLRLFEEAGIEIDQFYAPYQHRYAKQLLELFGVGSEQVIPEAAGRHLLPDQLVACSPISFPRREARQFLFERMAQQPWSQVASGKRKRIYISRAKAGWRKVLNEDQVMAMLARHGFQRYFLEDLNVREQIQLFQQAEMIVGPHGAGLANIVFTPPGAKVIEIGTVYRPFGYFHRLCTQCDHDMVWFLGQAVQGTRKEESHIVVDVAQLEGCLAQQPSRYLVAA
ncbi:glycosyltransferase family 61 protein [Bremerella cremea]|nr:glycosyltransferase family 61 protein [Bremerella cremea]